MQTRQQIMRGKRSRDNVGCRCEWGKGRRCANTALDSRGAGEQEDDTPTVGWKGFLRIVSNPAPAGATCVPNHKRDHHARAGQDPPAGIIVQRKKKRRRNPRGRALHALEAAAASCQEQFHGSNAGEADVPRASAGGRVCLSGLCHCPVWPTSGDGAVRVDAHVRARRSNFLAAALHCLPFEHGRTHDCTLLQLLLNMHTTLLGMQKGQPCADSYESDDLRQAARGSTTALDCPCQNFICASDRVSGTAQRLTPIIEPPFHQDMRLVLQCDVVWDTKSAVKRDNCGEADPKTQLPRFGSDSLDSVVCASRLEHDHRRRIPCPRAGGASMRPSLRPRPHADVTPSCVGYRASSACRSGGIWAAAAKSLTSVNIRRESDYTDGTPRPVPYPVGICCQTPSVFCDPLLSVLGPRRSMHLDNPSARTASCCGPMTAKIMIATHSSQQFGKLARRWYSSPKLTS
ncbi:hypothetical protein EK21DRAFT_91142 [Setomelanomma holmii]|uniref:Uncharacterized protein n=1 Tax=Setomelanomma holmii TaxID=210430 RepID=A0A9P4H777_9PLEO|nr:hypothetical protein EK21DRAFT_91142 [Setomelanomma holmii]